MVLTELPEEMFLSMLSTSLDKGLLSTSCAVLAWFESKLGFLSPGAVGGAAAELLYKMYTEIIFVDFLT